MKVLLTGSTGFLGSYLLSNLNSIKLLPYNRKESDKVEWNKLHGVIHCAGLAHKSHNENLKELYYLANVQLTKDLISHFINSPAQFFIFISTSTIYENAPGQNDIDESIVGKDLSIYAKSKLQAEQELLRITKKKVFILRPSVIVGPNPKGNVRLLHKLVHSKIPIPIPHNSSPNNLTDIRNLTKVIEFIGTNYNVLESGIYNVNDNLRPNIEDILKNLAKASGHKVKLIKVPNIIILFGLKIISCVKPEISKKLRSLFFDSVKISNRKISKTVNLDYNSFL